MALKAVPYLIALVVFLCAVWLSDAVTAETSSTKGQQSRTSLATPLRTRRDAGIAAERVKRTADIRDGRDDKSPEFPVILLDSYSRPHALRKRQVDYNSFKFGLGKRHAGDMEVGQEDPVENPFAGDLIEVVDDGDGLEKRAMDSQRFNFGLGKRSMDPLNFNFGLGKRVALDRQNFNFGLGKRRTDPMNFSFGLGKRMVDRQNFSFGLGKRQARNFEDFVEKRSRLDRNNFKFGLGKRNVDAMGFKFGLGKRRQPALDESLEDY